MFQLKLIKDKTFSYVQILKKTIVGKECEVFQDISWSWPSR